METDMSKMKCCNKCKEEKPLTEYSKGKSNKDGLNTHCKSCVKAYNIKWNIKNKEKVKQYNEQYFIDNPEYNKKWQRNNKEKQKSYHSKWMYKNKGVYEIFSNNLCLYVGQSTQINRRWINHKHCIKKPSYVMKSHPNVVELYNNIRSHSNVEFRIVEECSPEVLLHREQHYIDALKPLYNTNKT